MTSMNPDKDMTWEEYKQLPVVNHPWIAATSDELVPFLEQCMDEMRAEMSRREHFEKIENILRLYFKKYPNIQDFKLVKHVNNNVESYFVNDVLVLKAIGPIFDNKFIHYKYEVAK